MTLKEFYAVAEGDFIEAMEGLGKEERILKYLRKFPETQMTGKIREALDAKDFETAFREAHNLKGMCMNTALTKLRDVSSDLTESLRNGPTGDVEGFYELVDAEYKRICGLVSQID